MADALQARRERTSRTILPPPPLQASFNAGSWDFKYNNTALRAALGLLGLRYPAARRYACGGNQEGESIIAYLRSQGYVLTPFGARLWSRTMRHLLGSEGALSLRSLPMYWSTVAPCKADLAPSDAWTGQARPLKR